MLQRIVRSPFVPAFFLLIVIGFLVLSLLAPKVDPSLLRLGLLILTAVTAIWTALIFLYNRRHPKHRVKALGFVPAEFRETDEGHQWVTFKACRNVYIYYTLALPAAAGACFVFADYRLTALVGIGALGLGQYLVYWLTIRKLNQY
ncbi:hypothetical protein [Paenibacillus sp.]|uniref:hypothetical protein n=1 Tax=Paenibacillus sp. TaxID=58172 RepID=UPI0028111DC3|nr:hypothetical protein [Paenibacillus sp.]